MEVQQLIAQLRATVEGARSMPMSSSALIQRAEVLAQIDALDAALPAAFARSDRVYSERDQVVADARERADSILAAAAGEQEGLVSDAEVFRAAKSEADDERARTERECASLRRETDEYVDGRLANLEVALTKTLEAVTRGRDRLHGRSELDRLRELEDDTARFTFPGLDGTNDDPPT